MWYVRLTRSNEDQGIYARGTVGSHEDKNRAEVHADDLRKQDSNPDSKYEVLEMPWAVQITSKEGEVSIVDWHETEDAAKRHAAQVQRTNPFDEVEAVK